MSLILDDVSALGSGCDGEEPVCQVQVMFESRPQGSETALLLGAADRCGASLHRRLQAGPSAPSSQIYRALCVSG